MCISNNHMMQLLHWNFLQNYFEMMSWKLWEKLVEKRLVFLWLLLRAIVSIIFFHHPGFYFWMLRVLFCFVFISLLYQIGNTALFSILIRKIVNNYMQRWSWKLTDLGAENQQQIVPTLRNRQFFAAFYTDSAFWLGLWSD